MSNQFPFDESHYAWREVRSLLDQPEWQLSGQLIRKDGCEIYITKYGFEIARRDPKTLSNTQLAQVQIDLASPSFVAAMKYILDNPEEIMDRAVKQQVTSV